MVEAGDVRIVMRPLGYLYIEASAASAGQIGSIERYAKSAYRRLLSRVDGVLGAVESRMAQVSWVPGVVLTDPLVNRVEVRAGDWRAGLGAVGYALDALVKGVEALDAVLRAVMHMGRVRAVCRKSDATLGMPVPTRIAVHGFSARVEGQRAEVALEAGVERVVEVLGAKHYLPMGELVAKAVIEGYEIRGVYVQPLTPTRAGDGSDPLDSVYAWLKASLDAVCRSRDGSEAVLLVEAPSPGS